MSLRNWTKDELILAINLYCKIPFGKMHRGNPDIIDLAKLINRTPSAVSWKLVNFASLDPSLQQRGIRGAVNRSKRDEEIWNQFFDDLETLSYESEKLLAKYKGKKLEESASIFLDDLPKEGKEKERVTRVRVNQYFFRLTVLAAYNFRCCITGLSVPDLLVASHIVPWAQDKNNRLNPRNGLCLNALHDKAFDKGFITISNDHKIILSKKIKSILQNDAAMLFFKKFENNNILMPNRFLPDSEFIDFHRQHIFRDDMTIRFNGLPDAAKADVLKQLGDLNDYFDMDDYIDVEALEFQFVNLEYITLLAYLDEIFGSNLEDYINDEYILRLAEDIQTNGLRNPPVGGEGIHRMLAHAYLKRDMPYFIMSVNKNYSVA